MEDLSDRNLGDLMDALEEYSMVAVGRERWDQALASEGQRDSLLAALQDEVKARRRVAQNMNAEPHWANRTSPVADAIEAWCDRLQKIIDAHMNLPVEAGGEGE